MLIAGDIGGTKTDLAVYPIESEPHAPLAQAQFHSADYPSLQAMVSQFSAQVKVPVAYACFDVAGPVIDGRVKATNLPWVMDEISLAKDLNLKSVHVMNDLEAGRAGGAEIPKPPTFKPWNDLMAAISSKSASLDQSARLKAVG